MKVYNPNPNQTYNNIQYQEFKRGFLNDLEGMLIGSVLAPISLFLGLLTMGTLVLIAFGQVDYWGTTGKVLVGIGVPLIIILCIISKRIGNIIFMIWSLLLYIVIIIVPIVTITYLIGLKPVFEYLGF